MAQLLQLPQLHVTDFPVRFFFTMLKMIAATMPISTAQIIIVQKLPASHCSISSTPYFLVNFVASLYGLKSINSTNAIRRTAIIKPKTFRLPVNAPPI